MAAPNLGFDPYVTWGHPRRKTFNNGLDLGVLYIGNTTIPWNGLVTVVDKAAGISDDGYYIDGIKRLNRVTPSDFEADVEAYTAPSEFSQCDGVKTIFKGFTVTNQQRIPFNMSYRTMVGNASVGKDEGYLIHIIYNALATPTDTIYRTKSDQSHLDTMMWKLTTSPDTSIDGVIGAHFIIDSREIDPNLLIKLLKLMYGVKGVKNGRLPTPSAILDMFANPKGFGHGPFGHIAFGRI